MNDVIKRTVGIKSVQETSIKFDNPDAYDRWMGFWTKIVGSEFLRWFDPEMNKTWIDIGCGSGASTEQIVATCSPTLIDAIDPSEDQINFARKRKLPVSVNFDIGDAERLTKNDGYYDYAIMALVLFFVPNPDKGVAEMMRVCKSGGKIAAYVWDILGHGLPTSPIHQIFAAKGIPVLVPPRSEVSTKDALQLVFEKNGAKLVETATFKVERIFDSYEEYWSLSSKSNSVFPALKSLDPKLIDEVKNELKANLDIDQQGRVKATAHANAVKGYAD